MEQEVEKSLGITKLLQPQEIFDYIKPQTFDRFFNKTVVEMEDTEFFDFLLNNCDSWFVKVAEAYRYAGVDDINFSKIIRRQIYRLAGIENK